MLTMETTVQAKVGIWFVEANGPVMRFRSVYEGPKMNRGSPERTEMAQNRSAVRWSMFVEGQRPIIL